MVEPRRVTSDKNAKRTYKSVCKAAVNGYLKLSFATIDKLHNAKRTGDMWNVIRRIKPCNAISTVSLDALSEYYREKFMGRALQNDAVNTVAVNVNTKYCYGSLLGNRLVNLGISKQQHLYLKTEFNLKTQT